LFVLIHDYEIDVLESWDRDLLKDNTVNTLTTETFNHISTFNCLH